MMNSDFYQGMNRQVESLEAALGDEGIKWMTEKIAEFLNLPASYTAEVAVKWDDGNLKIENGDVVTEEKSFPMDYQYANNKLLEAGYMAVPDMKDTKKWAELTIEFFKQELKRSCVIKSTWDIKLEEVSEKKA